MDEFSGKQEAQFKQIKKENNRNYRLHSLPLLLFFTDNINFDWKSWRLIL